MLRPWETQFWLDNSPGKTLHTKLLNTLIIDIKNGRLSPGSMLPGSRSLAEKLGVNRKTVQQVYEELEAQGWLTTRPRSGTFISETLPEYGLSNSVKELLNNANKTENTTGLVDDLYQDAVNIQPQLSSNNDGTPDSRLIPYELLARTYRKTCIEMHRHPTSGYGDPRGTNELRESLAKMLSEDRFMNCSAEQICIVRGSQMGIYLASKILDSKKGAIVVEQLSYPPAQAAFESNGFSVIKCRLDHQGLDIDHLREILASDSVAAIYVTPHHQYPTTVSLPMERRLALLALSKEHNFAILEDDYDHEFHYQTNPIPPLASLPNSDNVVHIGSMSKVFSPDLRLGYIAADSLLIEQAAREIMLIDRQGNTITERVLSNLMESGEIKRHIRKARKHYEGRRNYTAQEFKRVFGDQVSFAIPTGGLAIWVDISQLINGRPLDDLPSNDSMLSTLFSTDQAAPTHIRFGFGALNETEITQSIEHLSQLLLETPD